MGIDWVRVYDFIDQQVLRRDALRRADDARLDRAVERAREQEQIVARMRAREIVMEEICEHGVYWRGGGER